MQFTVFAISAFVTMRLDCNARRYRHSSRMRQRGIRVFIVGTAALPGCGPGTFHNRARNLTAATLVWIRHRLLAQWVAAQGALIVARAVLSTTMALQLGASSFLYAAGSSGRGGTGGSSHHFLTCTHKHTERSVPYTKVCSTSCRTPLKRVASKLPLHRHHSLRHASIFQLFHTVLRDLCKTHTHTHLEST